MRYFAAFEGIGGFSRGIEEGYANWWNGRNGQANIQLSERCEAVDGSGNDNSQAERQDGRVINGSYPACVGVSEIDRYASAIYKYHYPNHQNYGDATKLIPGSIPDFDLLTGGFPCQAFSIAGKRQGFNEARGTLFFEIARILSHKRPRYFLLENVKGLLSHDEGKTYLTIIGILADLGYFLETVVLNSKDFGVPQNRERIFFVGHLAESGRSPRPILPFGEDGAVDKQMDGQQSQISGALNSAMSKRGNRQDANSRLFVKEQARNPKKQDDLIQVGNVDTAGHNSLWGRVYSPEGLTANLNANGGGMGAKTGLYAVNKTVMIDTRREDMRIYNDECSTLSARDYKGGMQVLTQHRIRRLTPIECERLQAFPDHWTEKGLFENGEVKDISDIQRYKCLGNAVTVSVIAWLVERILIHAEGGGRINAKTTT